MIVDRETHGTALSKNKLDLTCHFSTRRITRDPAFVLFAGEDISISSFVANVVTRFFSLDEIDLPPETLILINIDMGRKRIFQDALSDQLFQPRPFELMRRHRLTRVTKVYFVESPLLSPEQLAKARARITEVYGPFVNHSRAVVVCSDAKNRLQPLLGAYSTDYIKLLGDDYEVLDPDITPLRILVQRLAGAAKVILPEGDELSLLALLPERPPVVIEIPLDREVSELAKKVQRCIHPSPFSF